MWFSEPADVDDWIVTKRLIKTTLADRMSADAGIKPGTRGVVVGRSAWGSLDVRLDTGLLGGVHVRVPARDVRVVRKGGGAAEFSARTSRMNSIRAGVALALLFPLLWFIGSWYWHGGSDGGLIATLIDGVMSGTLDMVGYALSQPVHALVYVALVLGAGRFAFRA